MKDVNGIEIKIGDTVKTQQKPGGFMPPAPAQIGKVEQTIDAFGKKTLQIRYKKNGQNFDRFILLEGKINQVLS